MAVDHDDYVPTEDLILAKPRRHYRASVHAIHWQLRSLIGAEDQHLVYYVTGDLNKNVQRLNTITRETETIKRLPFSPRCLVAENGWVCCGGETGEFAAVNVRETETSGEAVQQQLNSFLETFPNPSEDFSSSDAFHAIMRARSNKNIMADSKKFGKELVNCITLWFTPTLAAPFVGAYTEPMAVLSNNDKTVALIRLRDLEVDEQISYPDCVNRAIISPDGRLLIAITDDPYLYIHERVEKSSRSAGSFRSTTTKYRWVSRGKIHLQNQRAEDPTCVRGSFAACFSGTGKYLAVGTQSASISIFDVAALTVAGVDPLLKTFGASRRSEECGAVRDMAFAPGYSDLLAWTEDRDRIGIADLRHGYVSRQVISLSNLEDYEHISITDKSAIDPRPLETRVSDTLSSNFASALDISPDNRDPLSRYYSPLTPQETMVLAALQEHRRRQEQREEREQRIRGQDEPPSTAPRSLWAERNTRSAQPSDSTSSSASSRPRGERSASASRTVNDFISDVRSQRERMRDQQERLRGPMREDSTSTADRRRVPPASWRVPMPALVTTQAGLNPSERRSLRLTVGSPYTDDLSINLSSSIVASRNAELTDYTQVEFHNSGDGGGGESSSSPSPYEGYRPTADADLRRRERAAYLMREWGENPSRRIERYFSRAGEPAAPDPHDTSGLAWSADGQRLIVGADDGIYEFHVNQMRRKLFPSVSLR
ncbi:hypothetical protein QBC34DRAFT_158672 [Podospora aff. communis PSN243]|uniref:DUF2415 domain-containing protein n=1 Tax=Podospora aff. communis PSN243 TaxID=3040156 RepID=A0AAV9H1A0_9PEZI|nr:hypothetical protein QBC34DRAFT_158672 [Podospora aff. communis PSN243]